MERVQEYARFNQIELANCQEYTKQFEIVAGQTVAVTTVLTPGPYPYLMQPSRSSPILRAHWHVDNVLAGQKPATVRTVPCGHHTILIRISGYEDYNTSLDLNRGQSALISAALAPVPVPVPEPSSTPPPTGIIVTSFFLEGLIISLMIRIEPGTGT